MADDFAIATASPRRVTIAGGEYLVGKFTPRDLGDLQAYLKESTPDPRLKARELCRELPDAVALRIWLDLNEEAKDWPPSPFSTEGNRALTTTAEGAARVLWVMLRKHNAGIDLPRAREMAESVPFGDLVRLIELGFPDEDFAPKAPTTPMEPEDRGPVPITGS